MDPFRIVWPNVKIKTPNHCGFTKAQILSPVCDAFVVVLQSSLIRKIKSYASGHGDMFLGVRKQIFTTS